MSGFRNLTLFVRLRSRIRRRAGVGLLRLGGLMETCGSSTKFGLLHWLTDATLGIAATPRLRAGRCRLRRPHT